jgi:hypothetical protein
VSDPQFELGLEFEVSPKLQVDLHPGTMIHKQLNHGGVFVEESLAMSIPYSAMNQLKLVLDSLSAASILLNTTT